MKVARTTRDRIATIKAEASAPKQHLHNLVIRLREHAGTKRIARQLEAVINKLEDWQRAA